MITIKTKRKPFEIKDSFEDFDRSDMIAYAQFVWLQLSKAFEVTEDEFGQRTSSVKDDGLLTLMKNTMLFKLTQLKGKQLLSIDDKIMAQLIMDHEVMDFIFKTPPPHPMYDIRPGKLVGPTDNFNVLVVSEFAFLEDLFARIKNPEDQVQFDTSLNLFLAILYRRKRKSIPINDPKYTGDRRVIFVKSMVEERLRVVSRLPFGQKLLPVIWYEAHRSTLPARFPNVFGSSGFYSPDSKSTPWIENILAMSDGKFGDFTDTEQTPIFHYLQEIERLKKQEKHLKNKTTP